MPRASGNSQKTLTAACTETLLTVSRSSKKRSSSDATSSGSHKGKKCPESRTATSASGSKLAACRGPLRNSLCRRHRLYGPSGPGLPLGQSIEYFNLPPAASVGNCFTDAVALADGTTLGTPQGEIAGHDIFTMVFTSRARKAAEWSKFETFLNSLDGLTPGTALQSVYSYAAGLGDPIDATKLPVVRTADDWTKSQDLAAREWVRDSLQLSVRNFKIRRDQLHLSDEDAWRMFHDGMLKELAYADYSRFARRGAAR